MPEVQEYKKKPRLSAATIFQRETPPIKKKIILLIQTHKIQFSRVITAYNFTRSRYIFKFFLNDSS